MLKILLVVLLIAVAIYGLVRLLERGAAKRKPPAPLAPDDDLDFLRDLDWQQRKDRQRRRKDSDPAAPDDGTDAGPADGTDEGPAKDPQDEADGPADPDEPLPS